MSELTPQLKAALREKLEHVFGLCSNTDGHQECGYDGYYDDEQKVDQIIAALQPEIERLVDLKVNEARLEEHTALIRFVVGKSDSEIAHWSLERSTPYSKYLHRLTQSNQKERL